jgi:hypothetical protein
MLHERKGQAPRSPVCQAWISNRGFQTGASYEWIWWLGGLNDGGLSGCFVVATQATDQRSAPITDNATVIEFSGRGAVADPLTNLLRKGARGLLHGADRGSE